MHFNILLAAILLVGLVSCTQKPASSTISLPTPPLSSPEQATSTTPVLTVTATILPPADRLLTICLGREPASLYYYDAASTAAQDVLSAIYDGPVDIQNYSERPVILENLPSLTSGGARIQPVEVNAGDLIVDRFGNPANLEAGVEYRPSGCTEYTCADTYTGDQPVRMDQLVLDFKLLPGVNWSDGTPLSSADSVYSFELARSLYPTIQPELIRRTLSYQALDESTVEWTGIPGYQDGNYHSKFFTPLPLHAWKGISPEELPTAEASARLPIGWGPYVIDQWIAGDHISLHKNPLYFRAEENLPRFDNLVFRFVASPAEALDALQASECDLIDQTAMLEAQDQRLSELEKAGQVQSFYQLDAGWEQLSFEIQPLDSQRVSFFNNQAVRQAIAMCIDRQALVAGQSLGNQLLTDSYTTPSNPLYNTGVEKYTFDPQAAATLLTSAGWQDPANDPSTPRIAQGETGVPDGTVFNVDYLVSSDTRAQADAQAIQQMLTQCGIATQIILSTPQEFLAAGPDGPVFGRAFDLAQFAWAVSFEPACNLFLTSEIPGPYPEYPKGWGGMNASGFSDPQFDQACGNALFSLPDSPQHQAQHFQAQEVFSTQLPALPLYLHYNVSAARPDLCGFSSTSAVDTPLWFLEQLDYGSGCSR
jgi:peptide/nickel transport system substrate-binding protein